MHRHRPVYSREALTNLSHYWYLFADMGASCCGAIRGVIPLNRPITVISRSCGVLESGDCCGRVQNRGSAYLEGGGMAVKVLAFEDDEPGVSTPTNSPNQGRKSHFSFRISHIFSPWARASPLSQNDVHCPLVCFHTFYLCLLLESFCELVLKAPSPELSESNGQASLSRDHKTLLEVMRVLALCSTFSTRSKSKSTTSMVPNHCRAWYKKESSLLLVGGMLLGSSYPRASNTGRDQCGIEHYTLYLEILPQCMSSMLNGSGRSQVGGSQKGGLKQSKGIYPVTHEIGVWFLAPPATLVPELEVLTKRREGDRTLRRKEEEIAPYTFQGARPQGSSRVYPLIAT
ncbi:hypothetical protein VNO77_19169 [Canavalia gladiata]|uniref:Uncharacterized protein n=1 Tax=Canavalia gladiata TaxID=3824 RepID=A0AAN9QIA2_CANGL